MEGVIIECFMKSGLGKTNKRTHCYGAEGTVCLGRRKLYHGDYVKSHHVNQSKITRNCTTTLEIALHHN